MTASMPNHCLSWDRVLPAPHALLNGHTNAALPRRSSSLLQHHLVSSKDLLDNPKDRRSTVPSISYHVDPSISPIRPIPLRSLQDASTSDQPTTGPLKRRRATSLMADESKTRETSPATTQDSISDTANQFCLCQPDPKIPRPRNAFILYRQHHQVAVVAKHPGLPNPEISKIIGEEWRALPSKTKNQWKALAEDEKLRHQQQYPDYRYQPRRFGRNGNSQNTSTSSSAGPPGNCLRCGGKTMNPPVTPHTPVFAPNGVLPPGMVRSPSTVNVAVSQASRRPHPLAHANLHRQVPYTVSSPPPPGSAITRVRPFGEVFAGGTPPTMSEAEYRARFASQPMSPDPKRRRFNGPGVMVPGRGPDLTSPNATYPLGHPYSPTRVSLPRPADAAMHPVHQRAATQGQIHRSNYPPQHPRYASVDARDPNLTLAPLQTPNPGAAFKAPNSQKRTSSGATTEAQIMSIPAVNKLRLLSKAAPPLSHPGAMTSGKSPLGPTTPESRGAILAIEGSEEDVRVVTDWLAEFLKNESDEFVVKAFFGPDISAVMAEVNNDGEADGVGTQQQRYLKAISEWHWVSKEVVNFVTSSPKTEEGVAMETSHFATHKNADSEQVSDQKKADGEMDIDATSPSTSPTSAVSPHTITQTERLSLKSPINLHPPNTTNLNTAPPPSSTTTSTPAPIPRTPPPHQPTQPAQPHRFPIALLPRYQLSSVDTAALTMPITDSYLPIDHWQWAAALWRGCVGPDVTIVVQDSHGYGSGSGYGGSVGPGGGGVGGSGGGGSSMGSGSAGSAGSATSGAGVEVRLGGGGGDVRAVIVRKGASASLGQSQSQSQTGNANGSGNGNANGNAAERKVSIEPGALRRVGFEIVEYLRR